MDIHNRRHALFQIFVLCICGITIVKPRHLADMLLTKTHSDRHPVRRTAIQHNYDIPHTIDPSLDISEQTTHKVRHSHAKKAHRRRSISAVTESMNVLDSPRVSISMHATTPALTSTGDDIIDKSSPYREKSMDTPLTGYRGNVTPQTSRPQSLQANPFSTSLITAESPTAENSPPKNITKTSNVQNPTPDPMDIMGRSAAKTEIPLDEKARLVLTESDSNEQAVTPGIANADISKDAPAIYTFTPIDHSQNNSQQQTSHNPEQLGNISESDRRKVNSTTQSDHENLSELNKNGSVTDSVVIQDSLLVSTSHNFPITSPSQVGTAENANKNIESGTMNDTTPVSVTSYPDRTLQYFEGQDNNNATDAPLPSHTVKVNNSESSLKVQPDIVLGITTEEYHASSFITKPSDDNNVELLSMPYDESSITSGLNETWITPDPNTSPVEPSMAQSIPDQTNTSETETTIDSKTDSAMPQTSPGVLDQQDKLSAQVTTPVMNDTVITYSMESSTPKVTSLANDYSYTADVNDSSAREAITTESNLQLSTLSLGLKTSNDSTDSFLYTITQRSVDINATKTTNSIIEPTMTTENVGDFQREISTDSPSEQTAIKDINAKTIADDFDFPSSNSNQNHSKLQTSPLPVIIHSTESNSKHFETSLVSEAATESIETAAITKVYSGDNIKNNTNVFNIFQSVTQTTLHQSPSNVTTNDPFIGEVPYPTERVRKFAADWDKLWLFILISCCVLAATLLVFLIALCAFFTLRKRKLPNKRGSTYDYYSHNSIKDHPFTDTELVYSTEVGNASESEEMTFGTFGKSRMRDRVIMSNSNEKITSQPFISSGVDVIRIKQMPRCTNGKKVEYV